MSIYSIGSYFYYLCRSMSEYYVHSPYVYDLMQKCLRSRNIFQSSKSNHTATCIEKYVAKEGIVVKFIDISIDLSSFTTSALPSNTVLVIESPHDSYEREKYFDILCKRKDITLSIDIFFTGIIFPHKDMKKEHFVLNYF